VGNPYSLAALLLFATPTSRLVPWTRVSMIKKTVCPPVLGGDAHSFS
jgi:hypothetical protein